MNSTRLTASIVAASFFLGTSAFADAKKTERAWKAKCAACHGAGGKGDTDKGKALKIEDMTTAAFQAKLPEAEARLDQIAEEARSEARLFADYPEPLLALIERTRVLSGA